MIAPHTPYCEQRWMALGVVVITQIMIMLDATVVNVALPSALHRGTAGIRDSLRCRWRGPEHRHADHRSGRLGWDRRCSSTRALDEIVSGLI